MKKPVLIAIYLANLFVILGVWWAGNSGLLSSSSTINLALARLAGLLGMFSILTQYLLISNAPWVNRTIGQYRMNTWHMLNGKLAFSLVLGHAILIMSVYGNPVLLPYVWLAALAFVILIATVGVAILRNHLPYKLWRGIHRLNYAISGLVIWHQLALGGDFQSNTILRIYWILLTVFATGNLIYFRLIYPRLLNRRH